MSMFIRYPLIVLLFSIVFPVAAGTLDEAKAAFKNGQELFDSQQYADASDEFRRAMQLSPSWKLNFNIAQCEAAARHFGVALEFFEKYLAAGGDDISPERTDYVLEEMERLRQMVGTLVFKDIPDGSLLVIDGNERGTFPLRIQVRLGIGIVHKITVTNGNTLILEQEVMPGAKQSITLSPAPVDKPIDKSEENIVEEVELTPSSALEPTPTLRLKPLKIAFWIASALAVASAGTATGFWLASESQYEKFKERNAMLDRGEIEVTDSKLNSYKDKTDAYDAATTVSLIATGVFAATAVTVAIFMLVKKRKSERINATYSAVSVRF